MPDLRASVALLRRLVRLSLRMPDYDAYRAHRRARHPGEPMLSRAAFVRRCQERRYGGGPGGAGCC